MLGPDVLHVTTTTAGESAEEITVGVITEAIRSGDAQAAREVLRHPAARGHLAAGPERELSVIVTRGPGRERLPETLLTRLEAPVGTAESVLAAALAGTAWRGTATRHCRPGAVLRVQGRAMPVPVLNYPGYRPVP